MSGDSEALLQAVRLYVDTPRYFSEHHFHVGEFLIVQRSQKIPVTGEASFSITAFRGAIQGLSLRLTLSQER